MTGVQTCALPICFPVTIMLYSRNIYKAAYSQRTAMGFPSLVQPFQYSEIFDLRDNSVFEFTVPYVASRDFISTLGTSGGVTLSVLDNLITTGESSSLVPYLVEVCAGDDFQLANYIGSGLGPCCTSGTNALVVYQSGLESKQEVDPSVEAYTSGERFTSVKQLAMIPYSIFSSYPASSNVVK